MARRQPLTLTPGQAVVTCTWCGFDWETPLRRGVYPDLCPDCLPPAPPPIKPTPFGAPPQDVLLVQVDPRSAHAVQGIDPDKVEAFLKLVDYVNLRLAVEEALPLLRMGKVQQAIACLERVPCRMRDSGTGRVRLAS